MKKRGIRIFSFILLLTTVLTIPVHAMEQGTIAKINGLSSMLNDIDISFTTENEVLYDENGKEYTVHNIITSEYSKSIAIDKNNNVIAEFTYIFDENTVYDINNNVVMIMNENTDKKIKEDTQMVVVNSLKWYYMGSFTGYFDITTTSSSILGVLIAALVPGVGAKAAVAIAVILINSGLKQVYYEMEMYSATDDEYQYVKRVAQFYKSRGGDSIGSPIEGIQKKSLDAA